MQPQRIPPLTASVNQACYTCFKEESSTIVLKRCSSCRRVSYCGADCQRKHWPEHKAFCKALVAVEQILVNRPDHLTPDIASCADVDQLNNIGEKNGIIKGSTLEAALKRALTIPERNLIGWEPRCIACASTEQDIYIQSRKSGQSTAGRMIKPCPNCRLTFYCCDAHWNMAKRIHEEEPCKDGHDDLTQCSLNQEIREDIRFVNSMAQTTSYFLWAPERTMPNWRSLKGASWFDAFEDDVNVDSSSRSVSKMPQMTSARFLRAASENLSFPMTVLWTLEAMNFDDGWTRQKTLTIHVLGAHDQEILGARIFEEILHRLPEVQTLSLILCGPQLSEIMPWDGEKSIKMDSCRDCLRKGRQRIHYYSRRTYHEFVAKAGRNFEKPDLAIAFNSGASQENTDSWIPTIKLLVTKKIPTVFTAYNHEEAKGESLLLRNAGAQLIDDLGPRQNPWRSMLAKTEPNKVLGFYAVNGWLAGGFR